MCSIKAQIISVSGNTKDNIIITVKYIGWSSEWNETLKRMSEITSRIVSHGTFVKKCKIWVKISDNLPKWPGIVYIRKPKPGSAKGISYLKEEQRLYIELYG